ncbi:hypothetical protein [Desulfurivibrio alkaliphilus]|uniref:PP-loop domain protein n=1 Tax=Desulfurivibrio alkaliphilus (strain DSM 19089 / UNIQEM U267 / AHT2) TaxID=589865 RepID=D6Z1M1_DESAT|nr:hypothetical protein [Desulfurivibrio alkaliphilus]ADH85446.1 hypothetical protein DaAHT2_0742 [Desulfurivibrio alkaliphilus AHT 2]
MSKQELAILFSGGTDSLAVYALAALGRHPELPRPVKIHLLHMLNGMSRFHDFPRQRFAAAQEILATKSMQPEKMPAAEMVELDSGRLFQGLWLDRYEELMPRYNGKNLVCVACKVAMHTKAILYCTENLVPVLAAGYAKRQDYYPEQTPVFMEKIAALSDHFGIRTIFPVFEDFDHEQITRHVLEDFGLPSTGGGERKCLFCQTLTTATEKEIGAYLDEMIPRAGEYIEHKLHGRIREAAGVFPPGR